MLLRRRAFLPSLAALLCATRVAQAGPARAPAFELKKLTVKGKHASRVNLLVPTHLGARKVRLLVALHGLGESHDAELGAAAWVDRYGLGSSYERLLASSVQRTGQKEHRSTAWTDDRLKEVNASLAAAPFRGLAVACPFTPSFKDVPDRARAIREYGEWIVGEVIPLARKEAPVTATASATTLDGCSMGGPFALDTFLAHPDAFGALGNIQGAFSDYRAPQYAKALAAAMDKHGPRRLHLLSSEGDKFSKSARALSAELGKRRIDHTLRILPGPHDQPWLREAGTIEMLLFHERG